MPPNILIIGAGLTGLTLAYYLKQKNSTVQIVEARERLGGRIHTLYSDQNAPLEMGATWLGKKHHHLTTLLQALNIGIFEQKLGDRAIYEPISTSPPQIVKLPPNTDPSFRIKGGTSTLIQALANELDPNTIHTGQRVQAIHQVADKIIVTTNHQSFEAAVVISTLPPFLLTETIDIQPALPANLLQLTQQTHTWMGESIKVALTYPSPFWRKENSSGTLFSNVGPIPEMYDHTNVEEDRFALKGFLNGTYYTLSKTERLELIRRQLRKYFGQQADDFTAYEEAVWRNDPFTFAPYPKHVLPHQNNGHPLFRQPYLDGRLFIAGAETAATFPGYMDGAVESAKFVSNQIVQMI